MYFLTWLARCLSEEFELETCTYGKKCNTRLMPFDLIPKPLTTAPSLVEPWL